MKVRIPTLVDMCLNGKAYIIKVDGAICLQSYGEIIAVYTEADCKIWRTKDFVTTTSRRHMTAFKAYILDGRNYDYEDLPKWECGKEVA